MKKLLKKIAAVTAALFILQVPVITPSANAAPACTSSQFTVEEKHNPVFYIDTPNILGNYVQFKITNKTGSTVTNYHARIENISSGGKLEIGTYETATHAFLTGSGALKNELAADSSINLFWYLTSSGTRNTASTFDVVIYDGVPGSGGSAVCQVSSTITKIDSTIAAQANKLTSVVYSTMPSGANADGSETVTVTVKGQTGTIGAGPSGDRDVNLSPATNANFDAARYRLSGTSYRCGSSAPVLNQLFIPNACSGNYTATFTYQYLTTSASAGTPTNVVSPIMQIASGSQMKHTATPTFTISAIGTNSLQVTTSSASNIDGTSATLNGSIGFGTYTTLYFCWSSTNPGSNFSNNCTYKATGTDDGNGNLTANLSGLTPGTTYFFELTGETGATTYTKGGVASFRARAVATTNDATNVESTTVTLNGIQTGLSLSDIDTSTTYFYYSTTDTSTGHINQNTGQRILVTASITGETFTANLTGLTPSTLYYFEVVVADSSTASYAGGLKSFTTSASGAVNYTITFDPNLGALASGNATDTGTVASGGDALSVKPTNPTRAGYTFLGWNTNSSAGSALSSPVAANSSFTLYAIWQSVSSGGGGSSPAPNTPKPPTISSISAPEVCAVMGQLVIKGTNLSGSTVKVDGLSTQVLSSSANELLIALPSAPVGTKTLTVTNSDGSATISLKYEFVDSPIYVDYLYPSTYANRAFSYTFKATDATKYEISGKLPAGLSLNSATGELSGTPTTVGEYEFIIMASNLCDQVPLIVYMYVDKAIPNAFTCSVDFNVAGSNTINAFRLANLERCLAKTETLSPKYVDPIIFLSGGIPSYLTEDEALTHPRYLPIIGVIQNLKVNAQIYLGAFEGTLNSVQVNVYWPEPEL